MWGDEVSRHRGSEWVLMNSEGWGAASSAAGPLCLSVQSELATGHSPCGCPSTMCLSHKQQHKVTEGLCARETEPEREKETEKRVGGDK